MGMSEIFEYLRFFSMPLLIIGGILLADLISGVIHWAEDSYGNEDWPILGKYVITPNLLHHTDALAFTKPGYYYRNRTTLAAAIVFGVVFWISGLINPLTVTAILVGSQTNEIHKWAHTPSARLWWPIRRLQHLGILQGAQHHWGHHRAPSMRHYCIITEFLNPLLDRLKVFRSIEAAVRKITGVAPRDFGALPV